MTAMESGRQIEDQDSSTAIIVPTYNRAHFLREALESLLAQTLPARRVIVIDDGSRDGTRDIADEFRGRVEYIYKENEGKAAALNLALMHVHESLVWIFDDDDVAEVDALERMANALRQNPRCGFAYGGYVKFWTDENTGARLYEEARVPQVPSDRLFPALMERCFILQCGLLVRRSCYDRLGKFDENLLRSQDYEMLLRLARHFEAVRVDGPLFQQRQHEGIRGPASMRMSFGELDKAWRGFDLQIVSALRPVLHLREYLDRSIGEDLNAADRLLALLQKFVIFARKDDWNSALQDLSELVEAFSKSGRSHLSEVERSILNRAFGLYSRAAVSVPAGGQVRSVLRRLRPALLRHEIIDALVLPLKFQLRVALRSKSFQSVRVASRAVMGVAGLPYLCVLLSGTVLARLTGRAADEFETLRASYEA